MAGLEAGSAVLSQEATAAAAEFYPNSIIAVTNHHVVGEQKSVMVNFHFSQTPFPAAVLKVCSAARSCLLAHRYSKRVLPNG